jgi:hypothetical protein
MKLIDLGDAVVETKQRQIPEEILDNLFELYPEA